MSTPKAATSTRDECRTIAPTLIEMTEKVVYGAAMTAGRIAKKVLDGAVS